MKVTFEVSVVSLNKGYLAHVTKTLCSSSWWPWAKRVTTVLEETYISNDGFYWYEDPSGTYLEHYSGLDRKLGCRARAIRDQIKFANLKKEVYGV